MAFVQLFLSLAIVFVSSTSGSRTPATVTAKDVATYAKLVGDSIVTLTSANSTCTKSSSDCAFGKWTYGNGIIVNGLVDASQGIPDCDYMKWVDTKLAVWSDTKRQNAYDVMHNTTIPWGYSIGDVIGLYPIAYLARANANNTTDPSSKDVQLCTQVANEYIMKWPDHWVDHTVSRAVGWSAEISKGNKTFPSFIWGDDAYMGLVLVSRLAALGLGDTLSYRSFLAQQQSLFAAMLQDVEGSDMLYYHGRNANDNTWSCCKWSRANGWTMMGHMETLLALDGHETEPFERVLKIFNSHADAAVKVQDKIDGRWHQLLNDTSTFHETSATAMFLLSFITGVEKGWLDKNTYDPVIKLAWSGLEKAMLPNGTVTGICQGFGIHDTPEQYATASTSYLSSSPGLGTVLRASVAMYKYLQTSEL